MKKCTDVTKIKICGLRREEDIAYANELHPDFVGYIMAPSKRQISCQQAVELRKKLRKDILAIGVFVNQPVSEIVGCVERGAFDWIQLHGDETEETIQKLREYVSVPIIKAVRVRSEQDCLQADKLSCEYLLFDTFSKDVYGGTGQSFSWEMIPSDLKHPYFLAGGIDSTNIKEAVTTGCYAVDVSSGAEIGGVKDKVKMEQLIRAVRAEKG